MSSIVNELWLETRASNVSGVAMGVEGGRCGSGGERCKMIVGDDGCW